MVQSRCNIHCKQCEDRTDTTEVIDDFVYRGTCITKHRDELKDISRKGLAYHSLLAIMKPTRVHRQTKIKPHETLNKVCLMVWQKAWTLSQTTEKTLNP